MSSYRKARGVPRRWEPGRYSSSLAAHVIGYGPQFRPPDSRVQEEFFDAERMADRVEPTDREWDAVDVAARYVGTSVSALAVLAAALYGVRPNHMTREQSRRTDGLIRLVWYVAREAGYEAALRRDPAGETSKREPTDPPSFLEEAA